MIRFGGEACQTVYDLRQPQVELEGEVLEVEQRHSWDDWNDLSQVQLKSFEGLTG